MTECMPIASLGSSYELDRAGSVGPAIGPELAISERGEVLGTIVNELCQKRLSELQTQL